MTETICGFNLAVTFITTEYNWWFEKKKNLFFGPGGEPQDHILISLELVAANSCKTLRYSRV